MSSGLLERRGVLELAMSSTMVIIMSIMFVHFIRNEWKHKSHRVGFKFWKLPSHTLCVFIAFLLYLLFTIESMILSAYWVFHAKPNQTFSAKLCLVHFTHLSPFTFGKVAMYLFWFIRLHQVFQSTWFAIPVRKLKCLAIAFNIPITITAWVMLLVSVPALKYVASPAASKANISSFTECSDIAMQYETPKINIVRAAALGIYTLAELIYSIVILRLFVGNILKLSIFCKTLPLKETVKCRIHNLKYYKHSKMIHTNKQQRKSRSKSRGYDDPNFSATNSEYFLRVSMKTANLLILAICTNYLIVIKFALDLTDWVFLIDVFSNYVSMYLSFGFASKYYDFIFSPCNDICYSCCVRLCYCCCLPKVNMDDKEKVGDDKQRPQLEIIVTETNHSPRNTLRVDSTSVTPDISTTTTTITTPVTTPSIIPQPLINSPTPDITTVINE